MPENTNLAKDIERRRYYRLRKKFTMHYCLAEDDLNTKFMSDGEIIDISGGGIRFLAPLKLPKNTQLLINLPLQDWGKNKIDWPTFLNTEENNDLTIMGKVMWAAEGKKNNNCYETGVCFIGRIESDKGDNL
jgi:hypothetical protein